LTEAAQNHAYSYLCYMQKLQRDGVVSSVNDDINSIPASKREHAVRLLDTVLQVTRDVDTALQCVNYSLGDIDEQ
jgi:hypothetical protein